MPAVPASVHFLTRLHTLCSVKTHMSIGMPTLGIPMLMYADAGHTKKEDYVSA